MTKRTRLFGATAVVWAFSACAPPPTVCPQPPPPLPAASAAPAATASAAAAVPPAPVDPVSEPLPRSTPAAEGIDEAALQKLVERARATASDALVVLRNGKLVGEWTFGTPVERIEAMSVTKSVVSLLIGTLVTDGKIKSLDQPVYEYYPEWRQGRKEKVTLRHLLNHTSGLQADRTTQEIYRSPDFLKLALAAELSTEPGAAFFYNNKAVAILAGIIQIASGKRMDEYARERLFKPLGIGQIDWDLDKAGNPHAMAGLQILPADLAKLGQLVLDRGAWKGQPVIASSYIDEATKESKPGTFCGLLWWLNVENVQRLIDKDAVAAWKAAGVDAKVLSKLAPLVNKQTEIGALRAEVGKLLGKEGMDGLLKTLASHQLTLGRTVRYDSYGVNANGYLGQYILVLPQERLVVVRMRRYPKDESKAEDQTLGFNDITELARGLVKKP